MKALFRASLASAALIVLVGCGGIEGKWVYDRTEPEGGESGFKLASAEFMADGTYSADAEYGEGETKTSTGKYEFTEGKLTLKPEGREERVYDAKLCGLRGELYVSSGEDDAKTTVVMKRD